MNKKKISVEVVAGKILVVRGKKVMLDRDFAGLYGVETFKRGRSRRLVYDQLKR